MKNQTSKAAPIRLCVPMLYSSTLAFIAEDEKNFKNAGVDVALTVLPYGKNCFDGMLAGQFDFAAAYLTPIVNGINAGKNFSIVSELHSSSENTKIVYRKDKLITKGENHHFKTIGLVQNTNAEFLLKMFASANSLDLDKIKVVYKEVDELESLLLKDELSAAIFWQPQVFRLTKENPDVLAIMPTPFYTDFSMLVGNEKFVSTNPASVVRLLKALQKSKDFLNNNPNAARTLAAKKLSDESPDLEIEKIFERTNIDLGLTPIFATMLASELKWKRKTVKLETEYDFSKTNLIRKDFLQQVIPAKVTIL